MGRIRSAFLAGAVLLAGSALAQAQNAYTSRAANVRAGPDRTYPLVAQLAPGTGVDVSGCLSDWSWCDVGFDDTHGWVYAPSLSYVYQGSRVPFYAYAPSFGLPVITFSLGSYWDQYYRGRPFFSQRAQWESRRIPHRRPSGPPPRSGPPPQHAAAGFRPQPGRPGPEPRGGSAMPERGAPQRGSRESGRANTGREVTPHREAPQRGAAPARGPQPDEKGRGSEHPQSSGRDDNRRKEGGGDQPH